MNRALWYLLYTEKRNAARQFVLGLRRPKKLIGVLFWLAFAVGLVMSQLAVSRAGQLQGASSSASVTAFLGFLMFASLVAGVMQRGLAFHPADLDFLFPGPFRPRELVLYRVLSLYPVTLLSTVFIMVFLTPHLPNLWWGFLGLQICQIISLHLQSISSILASAVAERTFARLRGGVQVLFVVLIAVGLFFAFATLADDGRLGGGLRGLFAEPWARTLLYPAACAADLALADSLDVALRPLLLLLAIAAGTLLVVVSLQINFFEASLETSQRYARFLARGKRGVAVNIGYKGDRVRAVAIPRLFLFRGAGALFWKNLLCAMRSLRVLFFGVVLVGLFSAVAVGMSHGDVSGAAGASASAVVGLAFGAFLPFMMQQYLAFDFRRDFECITVLKLLPISPIAAALAEVAVPSVLAYGYQILLVGVVWAFVGVPWELAVLAVVLYLPLTLCMSTVNNIGFLLYPVKTVTAAGRPNMGGVTVNALLNILVLLAAVVPATVIAIFAFALTSSPWVALAAGVGSQLVVDAAMLLLLGVLFERFDVSRELG